MAIYSHSLTLISVGGNDWAHTFSQRDICSGLRPLLFCPCCYVVAGWDGARQCHSALCLYTLALYYLIPDNPSLSPSLCCSAEHKHKHKHVTSLMASLSPSQAVVVYIHSVCGSVCCAPSAHLHSVQWGAAQLPTELLHAVAQWISYPRYIWLCL